MSVTFHRAFDMTKNALQSLEDLISLKVDRILTSGQAETAMQGKNLIKELVETAKDRIIIMAGAGINANNANDLVSSTKVNEIHLSALTKINGGMEYTKTEFFPSAPAPVTS